MSVGALYLHVPFCVRRCRYCDFTSAAVAHGDPLTGPYAEALTRLVGEARELDLLDRLSTAYIGGGTPTMLGADDLAALIAASSTTTELTFEANPESLTDDVLQAAVAAGATRVSIGVQSLDDRELGGLGRVHTAALARERVAAAVASGLRVSVDLMCGIPYQTPSSWEASLQSAVDLGVGHVSVYPLMIEPGTVMERMCESGELPWPSDDVEADGMESAARMLEQNGFERYEVASYARPGEACRHNIAYWTGTEYLGLGTAAASMLGRESYGLLRKAAPGLPAPRDGAVRFRLVVTSPTERIAQACGLEDLAFDVEQLTAREAAAEDLMLGMRMTRGVGSDLLAKAAEVIPQAALDSAVERSCELDLARWDEGRLVPTAKGWLMGNELYGLFWDLASDRD